MMEALAACLSEMIKQHGVMTVLAGLLLWKYSRDYDAVVAKLTSLEQFVRDTLLATLKDHAMVIQHNTDTMKKCKKEDAA